MATGFLYDDRFLNHDAGAGHPERPERLVRSVAHLRAQPWFDTLVQVKPTLATRDWIHHVHDSAYVDRATAACENGTPFLDTTDVGICADSYQVALLAAGGAMTLADQVIAGDIDNGFALMRPPGHHAERNMALGFCLLNNVAITACYLQKQHGLDKVLILDWDVHHGNGTQHTFEEDPSVLYISTHQYPYYPGTGAASETGVGAGSGATLNCPMPAGANDAVYEQAFAEKILPKIESFKPEAVILSAGFDAHVDDPLAHVSLSTAFFGWMTQRVMEVANQHANGRIISLLEGGYNVDVLPLCIETHVAGIAGIKNNGN